MRAINWIRHLFAKKDRFAAIADVTGDVSVPAFFEHNPCPMWIIDPETMRFLIVNNSAQRQYGYTALEFAKMQLHNIVLLKDGEDLYKVISDKKYFLTPYSAIHKHKNGQTFNVQVYAQAVTYKGSPARLDFIMKNEAAARAEAESKVLNEKMEDILESISDGFFTLDNDWKFTYVNKAYTDTHKAQKENFIGNNFWEYFPIALKQKFYTEYHRAVNDRVNVHFEEYSWYLDKWISVHAYPTEAGLTVYFTDITEQRKYRLQIEAHNNILKEIAWIQSHKVRSPLASILGLTELFAQKNSDPEEIRIIIEGIRSKAEDLDRIIREINEKTRDTEVE